MIVAEQRDGALRKISLELASTARRLADQTGDEVSAILLGSGIEGLAIELGKYGVDKVFVGDNAAMEPYITEAHAAVVAKVVKENDPAILLLGASVQGKDLVPARIGEHRARPRHQPVDPAQPLEHFRPRPQQQMIGVSQDDRRARGVQVARFQGLDRGLGAHRHEDRRINYAMRSPEAA